MSRKFAEIAPALPVDGLFHYEVPQEFRSIISVGMRALVPFGQRIVTGYVVGFAAEPQVAETKPILDLPDQEPLFDPDLLEMTQWISQYYLCSWGQALECAAPPGLRIESRRKVSLSPETAEKLPEVIKRFELSAPLQSRVLRFLSDMGSASVLQIRKSISAGGIYQALHSLEASGLIRVQTVMPSPVGPKMLLSCGLNPQVDDLEARLAQLRRRAWKQAAVLEWLMSQEGEVPVWVAVKETGASLGTLRALEKRGLVVLVKREVMRDPVSHAATLPSTRPQLNDEQLAALGRIEAATDAGAFQTILLQGITGSGKTEVYLHAIDTVLDRGKSVIVLVPEIALTTQIVERFRSRFGDKVGVLHSRLSVGERYDQWRQVKSGAVPIVVGARSAIFAPVKNLGLIVVDEEHDPSYKQNETPRYNARDVAIVRARTAGAVAVLGTATPSLETYYNVERGKYDKVELTARVQDKPLPPVRIVDMRADRTPRRSAVFSTILAEKIEEKLSRGEQMIIFLNRRGYSPFILCERCGNSVGCKRCSVAMTYHAYERSLMCHYCNMTSRVPTECPNCQSDRLIQYGVGTERVEEELGRLFPQAAVQRMDSDTTVRKGSHGRILKSFEKGEISILVGTQMLAKGLDFPKVTLVGVVSADTALNIPDFRAGERTFQLLMQVAGRAGRSELEGEVIVQSYNPTHFGILAARKHDYATFYKQEKAIRQELGYPPFCHLVNVTVEGRSQKSVIEVAQRMGQHATSLLAAAKVRGSRVLGPAPAPLSRLKGRYRWHLALLAPNTNLLCDVGRSLLEHYRSLPRGKVSCIIDMDAQMVI